MRSSHSLDAIDVQFDEDHLVADAGLLLTATLAQHLGLGELLNTVNLGSAPGHANPGLKAMTLIDSILSGGDCIDDADALRSGSAASVLGHKVRAPSTLGTFLRSFSWADARQLDRVSREVLARAWSAGAGPGAAPLTIDLDSSICETYGLKKEGGKFGHTHVRGYHPLFATREGTGEVLHCRLRGGNAHTGRGAGGFLTETFARVREAGAMGKLTVRADSGFYSKKVVTACQDAGADWSITTKMSPGLRKRIEQIPDEGWVAIPYFLGGADVAETTYAAFAKGKKSNATEYRLIVRRVRPTPGSQLSLLVEFSYHAFITNRTGPMLEVETDHRRHAEVELAIRDLKYGVGLNHLPSGRFGANAAWLAFNALAHNLSRWVGIIGLGEGSFVATKTLRRRFLCLAGRITRGSRKRTLHMPRDWPWAAQFLAALELLRAVVVIV
jgi:hypothetical protein